MDCLKSFYLTIDNGTLWVSPDAETWGSGSYLNWYVRKDADSTFTIEGFKNINLYSIEMSGSCTVDKAQVAGECIVNDYGFFMALTGQKPLISGKVEASPNFWSINPTEDEFALSKYLPKINFVSPIQSLKSIRFNSFFASGTGGNTTNQVALRSNLTFTFLYKYEGE